MFRHSGSEGRLPLLRTTVKAAAAIALVSYFAANWLSSGLDRNALAQLASNVAAPLGAADPATTGAIAQAANGAKLDPCTGQRRP